MASPAGISAADLRRQFTGVSAASLNEALEALIAVGVARREGDTWHRP